MPSIAARCDATITFVSGEPPSSNPSPSTAPTGDQLDSWKEIAAYLRRDVTTVQRWEKREGMPVHRHLHDKMGSVYAVRAELDAWVDSRRRLAASGLAGAVQRDSADSPDIGRFVAEDDNAAPIQSEAPTQARTRSFMRRRVLVWAGAAVTAMAVVVVLWRLDRRDAFWKNPIADAKFIQVTGLDGTEPAVAISRDGKFVAFLANRDGHIDVWMTQIGTGQFHNLTHDLKRELVNPSIRTLGFSSDGALVTFWTRKPNPPATDIAIWAAPILGGEPRPYLDGAAEFDWTSDGSRLVYHTTGPGDPMFVRNPAQTPESRRIFAAPAGLHSHFLLWSKDQAFIYFVQGTLPEPMDIWRITPTGGIPERITHHESRVSHPVFVNPRTLVYLATDSSGAGPWLYSTDVERRIPHRVSAGIDTYTSLAASADGDRLVATQSTTRTSLWRLSHTDATFDTSSVSRISLSTDSAFSPRLGPGYVLYVSSLGETDTIWKQEGDTATALWTEPEARILGGPAIDPNGHRIAFSTRQGRQALLYIMNVDGTGATVVARSLEWQGAPAWAPDGRSITAAALDGGVPHLFSVSLDGHPPAPVGGEEALDPVWSPDGRFVVFSGPDIGTTFPVKAMNDDGSAHPLPSIMLSRGARRLRFLPGRRALVVLKGEIKHKDLWWIDLETGAEHQLTKLAPDFEVQDFDISPDGRDVVLQRAQVHSEIVLLDLPRR